MPPIIGIDLGTTNSRMAYVDYRTGLPRVISDRRGQVLVPSVVSFKPEGPLAGVDAKSLPAREPASTVFPGYDDVVSDLTDMPFTVLPGERAPRADDGEIAPPEASAIVLRTLKARADAHFGEPVRRAVITVPAYFDESRRQATRDAGQIAGFEMVGLLDEPIAAALAYGLERQPNAVIAIYDLGRRTFAISLLQARYGVFELLATNGHAQLGSDDFDRALVDLMLEDIRQRHGTDLAGDREARQRLRLAAEAAKRELSSRPRATVRLSFDDLKYHREITRAEFRRPHRPLRRWNPDSVPTGAPGRRAGAGRCRRGRAGWWLDAGAPGATPRGESVRAPGTMRARSGRGGGDGSRGPGEHPEG